MKGGKGGQGRKRAPAAKPTAVEKAWEKSRQGPKRGAPKRDWGAVEREVPRKPPADKPKP